MAGDDVAVILNAAVSDIGQNAASLTVTAEGNMQGAQATYYQLDALHSSELTSTATEGRRKYSGKIAAATETDVTLELEGGESDTLDYRDVKTCKMKPTYDFKPAKEGK